VSLYLVRHAKAGNRSAWHGDDWKRPLSRAGHLQALAIADRLAGEGIKTLCSSPYVRCVQTLEPLAERAGLPIAADERLAEGAQLADTLELMLIEDAGDGAVLCTHGDVLTDVVKALVRRGAELTTPPEWRKGSVWILDDTTVAAEAPPDA
jgi:phosphohistidine phosphatase SixA